MVMNSLLLFVYAFFFLQVKSDMRLADIVRTSLPEQGRTILDALSKNELDADCQLYLEQIKSKKHQPKKSEGTWPLSALQEQHDVIIIGN